MAKRFTDTDKIKKAFWRELSLEAKVFWDYICLDCNHAGIWEADFKTFHGRTGVTLTSLALASELGSRIRVLDGGSKWFIPSFVEFQYQVESYRDLNPKNRVHESVIQILRKEGVYDPPQLQAPLSPKHPEAPSEAPYIGAKDKDKEKDKDMDKDKDKEKDKERAGLIFNLHGDKSLLMANPGEPLADFVRRLVKNGKGIEDVEFQPLISEHGLEKISKLAFLSYGKRRCVPIQSEPKLEMS